MATGLIPNPVPGGTYRDTYGAPRSGGRRHAGVDIFAPRGTPILSPVSGRVAVVGPAGNGGNRVWVVGDDGRAYYFAHLQQIDAKQGQSVGVGTMLGTVGSTGNAEGGSPHLHFSINGKVGNENPVVNPFDVITGTAKMTPVVGMASSPGGGASLGVQPAGIRVPGTGINIDVPNPLEGIGNLLGGVAESGVKAFFTILFSSEVTKIVVRGMEIVAGAVLMGGGIVVLGITLGSKTEPGSALLGASSPTRAVTKTASRATGAVRQAKTNRDVASLEQRSRQQSGAASNEPTEVALRRHRQGQRRKYRQLTTINNKF